MRTSLLPPSLLRQAVAKVGRRRRRGGVMAALMAEVVRRRDAMALPCIVAWLAAACHDAIACEDGEGGGHRCCRFGF